MPGGWYYTIEILDQTGSHGYHKGMSQCIIPKQKPDTNGYVRIKRYGRRYKERCHVIAWEMVHGKIPEGMLVCHSCDNRACHNVEHLFLGTHAVNSRDSALKMRSTIGSRNPAAKLTEQQVIHIRLELNNGLKVADIAARFGVSVGVIYDIRCGRTWGWLDADPVTRRS